MPIDWFTVVAQAINFLILVALLKRFLYGPIVRAMERREERLQSTLRDAEAQRDEAEAQRERLERERRGIEHERDQALAEAREQAERKRNELMERAREDAERKQREWAKAIDRRREDLIQRFARRAGEEGVGIASATLSELAGADLQARSVERFIERLGELDDGERRALRESDRSSATVRTPEKLDDALRDRLRERLADALGEPAIDVAFETDPGLLCGVEAEAGGRRVGWSGRDRLEEARRALEETLEEVRRRAPEAPSGEEGDGGPAGE